MHNTTDSTGDAQPTLRGAKETCEMGFAQVGRGLVTVVIGAVIAGQTVLRGVEWVLRQVNGWLTQHGGLDGQTSGVVQLLDGRQHKWQEDQNPK